VNKDYKKYDSSRCLWYDAADLAATCPVVPNPAAPYVTILLTVFETTDRVAGRPAVCRAAGGLRDPPR